MILFCCDILCLFKNTEHVYCCLSIQLCCLSFVYWNSIWYEICILFFKSRHIINCTQLVANKKGLVVVVSLSFRMIEWTGSLVFFVRVNVKLETWSVLLMFHWVCVLRALSVGAYHPQRIHFCLSQCKYCKWLLFMILCQLAGRPILILESLIIKDLRCLCQPQISSHRRWSCTV